MFLGPTPVVIMVFLKTDNEPELVKSLNIVIVIIVADPTTVNENIVF